MKQPVIRQVKTMNVSCDTIGNLLLCRFACQDARDVAAVVPASIAFWLLRHIPVNEDPSLQRPPPGPAIDQRDWDESITPQVLSVQCKQFDTTLRMSLELDRKPDLVLLFDLPNLELLRRYLMAYSNDIADIGVE